MDFFFVSGPRRFRVRQSVAKLRLMPSSWRRFGLELYQGQVGLRLYPCQDALVGGGVKSPLLPAAMGFGGDGAGCTVALQELFDE